MFLDLFMLGSSCLAKVIIHVLMSCSCQIIYTGPGKRRLVKPDDVSLTERVLLIPPCTLNYGNYSVQLEVQYYELIDWVGGLHRKLLLWTECSEVRALWLKAKCFPVWPSLTQLSEYFTILPLVWVCGAGWLFPDWLASVCLALHRPTNECFLYRNTSVALHGVW